MWPGGPTDFDGNFALSHLEPGVYDITVTYLGYDTVKINDVVSKGKVNNLTVSLGLSSKYKVPKDVVIVWGRAKVNKYAPAKTRLNAEQIKNMGH